MATEIMRSSPEPNWATSKFIPDKISDGCTAGRRALDGSGISIAGSRLHRSAVCKRFSPHGLSLLTPNTEYDSHCIRAEPGPSVPSAVIFRPGYVVSAPRRVICPICEISQPRRPTFATNKVSTWSWTVVKTAELVCMGILQRAPRLANGLRDPGKDVEYSRICRPDTQIRCYRCLGRAELKASVASHHMLSNMVEVIGHSGRLQPNENGPIRGDSCCRVRANIGRLRKAATQGSAIVPASTAKNSRR